MRLWILASSFLSLALVLGSEKSPAQSKWLKGVVVTNQGDTAQGYINYRDSHLSPKSINFSVKADGKDSKKFTPADIRGFIVNGEQPFTSYIGPVSANPTEVGKIPYANERNLAKYDIFNNDMVFLGQLVAGNISLFELDDIKQHFFIQSRDGHIFELLNKFYMMPGGIEYKMNDKVYLLQIDSLLRANNISTITIDDLQKIEYRKNDVYKLVLRINGASGNPTKTTEYKKRKPEQRIGVGAGIIFFNMDYSNSYLANRQSKGSSPQAYLYYDFTGIASSNKLFGRLESRYQELALVMNDYHTGYVQKYTATIRNLSIIPFVNYAFIKCQGIEIYAGIGIDINFNLKKTGPLWELTDTLYSANSVPYSQVSYSDDHDIKWAWASLNIHAGAVFVKKVNLDFSYDFRTAANVPGDTGVIRLELFAFRLSYVFGL